MRLKQLKPYYISKALLLQHCDEEVETSKNILLQTRKEQQLKHYAEVTETMKHHEHIIANNTEQTVATTWNNHRDIKLKQLKTILQHLKQYYCNIN
jgi:hypothetical protein